MRVRLVHTTLACRSWHPRPEDCGLGCKVWRGSILDEAVDNLTRFLSIKHSPAPATEAEIGALPLVRKRRERVIRKLRARRMKRYMQTWSERKVLKLEKRKAG